MGATGSKHEPQLTDDGDFAWTVVPPKEVSRGTKK